MKKYTYDNATVYITIPNEQQLGNIRKSTERFVYQLIKNGVDISEWCSKSNTRTRNDNNRKRNRTTSKTKRSRSIRKTN